MGNGNDIFMVNQLGEIGRGVRIEHFEPYPVKIIGFLKKLFYALTIDM